MSKQSIFCVFCKKEHEVEIRNEMDTCTFKNLQIEYVSEFCVCLEENDMFYTEEQLRKNHQSIEKAYAEKLQKLLDGQKELDKLALLCTKEQLEVIYRAVKTCYQQTYAQTLVNDEKSLILRETYKKQLKEYSQIMRLINEHTDNLLDEV